jgi:transcriptional regulator with XRE-family HTH domain
MMYPIGYTYPVATSTLIRSSRRASGLSQEELARRSHTSRTTLSAYEHGRKSPTLETAQRILSRTGHDLVARPRIGFAKHRTRRGRVVYVPDALPQLRPQNALGTVALPLRLNWSDPGRTFDLRDRADRARIYEIVLREGEPKDILAYVDGTLLVDLWQELVLPREVRDLWTPLVSRTAGRAMA